MFRKISAKEKLHNYVAIDLFEDIIALLIKNSQTENQSIELQKIKTLCCFC